MSILGYRLTCVDTTYACGMQGTEYTEWIKHFRELSHAVQFAENEVNETIVWTASDSGERLTSKTFGKGKFVVYKIETIPCMD